MIDVISPMLKMFLPFAQEQMGFEEPPKLFLKGSKANAADPLGKTAYYDPENRSITVYITDRHPKDVMRSISHELVHHAQNCRGEFTDVGEMGEDYAQNNKHLRELEREAYEKGNLCFRDWSDSLKNTIYFEHLTRGDDNLMSTKTWKNREINSLLTESWGLKMDLEALAEESDVNTSETAEAGETISTEPIEEDAAETADKPSLEQIEEVARRVMARIKENK